MILPFSESYPVTVLEAFYQDGWWLPVPELRKLRFLSVHLTG